MRQNLNKQGLQRLEADLRKKLDLLVLSYAYREEIQVDIQERGYEFDVPLILEIETGKVRGAINHLEKEIKKIN